MNEDIRNKNSVCRDYLRNLCQRGRRCRYDHPTLAELDEVVDVSESDVTYEFCHDFQNNQCQRTSCRFIHCSTQEEENYYSQKKLPYKLKLQFEFGISDCFLGKEKLEMKPIDTTSPICRDFLNRECFRGKKCKFLHLDAQQASKFAEDMNTMVAAVKRPRILMDGMNNFDEDCKDFPTFTSGSRDDSMFDVTKRQLAEENLTLKKRIQELEKQVSDLAATNEVLLEQNAQFRFQKRGISVFGMNSETMTSTFKPNVAISNPGNLQQNVVANNQPQGVPVQLSVQVTGQSAGQEMMNGPTGQPQQQGTVVATGARLQQVPVSLPQTTDIAAQVITANLAVNSGNNVETIQAGNQQIMIAQPANLGQLGASFPGPVPNQMSQQQAMGSFAGGGPTRNQMTQQPVSFAGTIMAAALGGGRCAIQTGTNAIVTLPVEVHQSSMGHTVQLAPVVYTVTRSTGNVPLASTVVTGTGNEITLVADTLRNPVCSMPPSMYPSLVHPSVVHPAVPFNNVSPGNQASSHQNSGLPRTSVINTSMQQVVRNNLAPSPQVNTGPRPVVPPGAPPMNEQGLISFPITAVQAPPMHN